MKTETVHNLIGTLAESRISDEITLLPAADGFKSELTPPTPPLPTLTRYDNDSRR
jgi:hypothetical protein